MSYSELLGLETTTKAGHHCPVAEQHFQYWSMAHHASGQLVLFQALHTHTPLEVECYLELFSHRPSLQRSSRAPPSMRAAATRGGACGPRRAWCGAPLAPLAPAPREPCRRRRAAPPCGATACGVHGADKEQWATRAQRKIERRRQGSKVLAALPVRVVLHFLLGDWLGRGERGQLELQLRRSMSSECTPGVKHAKKCTLGSIRQHHRQVDSPR